MKRLSHSEDFQGFVTFFFRFFRDWLMCENLTTRFMKKVSSLLLFFKMSYYDEYIEKIK